MRRLMHNCIIFIINPRLKQTMRTTLTIDDELFDQAMALSEAGIDKAELLREAMRTYVRVQAAKRLAALGGAAPAMSPVPRRRPVNDPRP